MAGFSFSVCEVIVMLKDRDALSILFLFIFLGLSFLGVFSWPGILYFKMAGIFFVLTFLHRSYFICKKEEMEENVYQNVRLWIQQLRCKTNTQMPIWVEQLEEKFLNAEKWVDHETIIMFWERLQKERQILWCGDFNDFILRPLLDIDGNNKSIEGTDDDLTN